MDQAKRNLAVAVYNHYKRLQQPKDEDGVEIEEGVDGLIHISDLHSDL